MSKIGFLGGRFQPFHLGHLETVKQVYEEEVQGEGYEELAIGIVNPNPLERRDDELGESDAFALENNPFTYGERMRMIRESLSSEGIDDVYIFPFYPYRGLEPSREKAQMFAPHPLERYESLVAEGDWKIEWFREKGIDFRTVPVKKDEGGEAYSGTKVRESLLEGDGRWRGWVSDEVEEIIEGIDVDERLEN